MCRSTMTDQEYDALQERIEARRPTACPQCGSADIIPTFEPVGGDYECQAAGCRALWSPER